MSVNTRSPIRMLGAVNASGNINDGAMAFNQGGQYTYSCYSGGLLGLGSGSVNPAVNAATVGGHACIVSGPGRLNLIFAHQVSSSGLSPVIFYDSNLAALSGVSSFALSGYPVVGVLAAVPPPISGLMGNSPAQHTNGFPFTNGLSVSAASGAPGFSCTWTLGNQAYVGP
ncbi:hypothetical protein C4577_02280 [Candidatus Parcubacteria bacterium]|nr:MAG: hypothetical protein C4577_02280 [Candidatus Parcubacteria bacterium]